MPIFSYKALNSRGKKIQGMINGFNKASASENLTARGFEVVSLEDKSDSLELKLTLLINPVSVKDLVVFSRQFSVMISANLALVQSLQIVAEQTENITLKTIISEVAYEVDGGVPLSAALAKRVKIFSQFYVSVVRSGESSGKLDEVLVYLADEMEKDYDMISKIKGAMIYPVFIMVGLTVVGAVMMVVVIPKLTDILKETGGELPIATRMIMGVSAILSSYWFFVLVAIIGIGICYKWYAGTKNGKVVIDMVKLRLPVFGKLFQYIYLVRFTRSMYTLINGGVNMTKGLEIVAEVVGNEVYKDLINKGIEEVKEGNSLSTVFEANDYVPTMIAQMINVGEKTGKLDLVMEKITGFYSREIDNMLRNLVTLMEPLIMVVMGVAVGIMVAAVLMPMYNMASEF